MSDIETREDEWARGVFDRAHASHEEPHWIPDAAAASRLSTRRRTRYRMTGALAVVAVAGLSASAFVTLSGGAVGGGQTTAAPGTRPYSPPKNAKTIEPADLGKYLADGLVYSNAKAMDSTGVPAAAATTMSTVVSGVDPDLTHVRAASPSPVSIVAEAPSNLRDVSGFGFWTADGRAPAPVVPSKALGSLYISVYSSWEAAHQIHLADQNTVCGVANTWVPPRYWPTSWSPCTRQTQSDGSVIITTHSTGANGGELSIAARRFPDGSMVTIGASSVVYYTQDPRGTYMFLRYGASLETKGVVAGKALAKVPWTDDSLADALSGPNVKGLP